MKYEMITHTEVSKFNSALNRAIASGAKLYGQPFACPHAGICQAVIHDAPTVSSPILPSTANLRTLGQRPK